ncbi:protein SLOW WALKER 1-like [Phragmites australis]|uniref:protein SLOW WALKER 1-like n=1 Tax=Phragmites australis TaxID=29695 RepID=UPI002D79CF34|nr:protein SLOW WALKER 1-like [Phragmites australis]
MTADTSKPFFPAVPHAVLLPSRGAASRASPESSYWRAFRSSELVSGAEFAVTDLTFAPADRASPTLAAAWSTSVHLFSGDPLEPLPRISVAADLAFSPSFRSDGALLAAGDKKGVVRIFRADKPTAGPLRTLRSHTTETRVVRYPVAGGDKLHLLTAGDDALLAYWDVPSEKPVFTVPAAHRDYIRGGAASPADHNLFATGSYDRSVKLWDARTGNTGPSLSFSHGGLVESVLFLPSGGLLATAGGNVVKIWDVIGGGRLVHSVESHVKTVMALALGKLCNTGEVRLLSAGIDGYVKSFDFGNLKITHSMRHPQPLLSVACSPCGSVLVAGSSKGKIYMGKRKKKAVNEEEGRKGVSGEIDWVSPEPEKPVLRPNYFRYFRRGQNEKSKEGDFVIAKPKKVKFTEHDRLLRKFRHKDALVSALVKNNPRSVVAVMEELVTRRKLMRCIGNLGTEELGLLLEFLYRNATLPRYARFLLVVANKVVEMRAEDIRSDDKLRGYMRNIKRMVAEEIQIQHTLQGIQGMISPMLALASR